MALERAVSFAAGTVLASAVALIAFNCAEASAGWAFFHDVWSCLGSGRGEEAMM